MPVITEVASKASLDAHIANLSPSTLSVIYYYDARDVSCERAIGDIRTVAAEYDSERKRELLSIALVGVDTARSAETDSKKYGIFVVPYLVFISQGRVRQAISTFDVTKFRNAVSDQVAAAAAPRFTEAISRIIPADQFNNEPLAKRLTNLTRYATIVLFMKGNPESPACRFSAKMVKLLNDNSVKYASYNILMNDDVREGLKEFGNWPTYPQLWVKGQLAGGLDVVGSLPIHQYAFSYPWLIMNDGKHRFVTN